MKPRRRFVEQVERPAGRFFGEFGGEFEALGLPTGECRGRLAELQVAKTDLLQDLQLSVDGGDGAEESRRLVDRKLQHIGDVLPPVGDLEGLPVESAPSAEFALHEDIGEEVHLDPDHPVPLALLTAPTLHVAGETGRGISAHLGGGESAEEIADRSEDTGVGGGIGAGRAADRTLVDDHHLVEGLCPENAAMGARRLLRPVELACKRSVKNVVHQR